MNLCDKCIHKDVCKNVTNVNESEGVVCPNRLVILFLCDKRADCKSPCYPDCHLTTDIRHAKNFERVQQYSDLDSGYRVFKEIEFEDRLDSEKDNLRMFVLHDDATAECEPPEDEKEEDWLDPEKDEDEEPYIIPYVDDDWTALNERPFEGRPGTDA